jgi:hypothetical protein
MEQVNAKRVAIFVVSACLIGMAVGSAITLAVLNVQRLFHLQAWLWLLTSESTLTIAL